MRAVVVQHVAFEGPALIGETLAAHGLDVEVLRMDLGAALPSVDEVAGLGAVVVMGGPMGAMDDDAFPYLAAERALLRSCVELDVPVLGVCLGAQLLAAALGAEVRTGPVEEVGIGTVTLTADGRGDAVLGPAGSSMPVLHWHRDTFALPAGATRLASTADYPNQAFRIGRSYGLQFHVETDAAALETMAPELPPQVRLDPDRVAAVAANGRGVLGRWARATLH